MNTLKQPWWPFVDFTAVVHRYTEFTMLEDIRVLHAVFSLTYYFITVRDVVI